MKSFEFFIKILSEIGKSRKRKQNTVLSQTNTKSNIQIRSLINRDKKTSGSFNGPLHPNEFIYPSGNRLKRQTEIATRTRALSVAVKNNFIEQPLFLSTKKEKKITKKSATVLKMTKNRLISSIERSFLDRSIFDKHSRIVDMVLHSVPPTNSFILTSLQKG